ncbi:oligosaccharide flippase family protein [Roseimaritima sediminicola]|uniref:oligosaccharide flippase family protein n=1 Tax=Roseimaritima sediminicola TaxID=2662066 RepID=UPI00129845C8|nr:oligosaccharide flippase family protein [Roseimaritima sediminicola]
MKTRNEAATESPTSSNSSRRHLNNFVASGALQLIAVLAPLTTLLLMARCYDMAAFGQYSVALAFVNVLTVFFGLGASAATCFQIARIERQHLRRQDGVIGAGLLSVLCFTLFFSPFAWVIPWLLGYSNETRQLVLLLTAGGWCSVISDLLNGVYRGRREMSWQLIPVASVAVATLVCVTPLLIAGKPLKQVAVTWSACQLLGPCILFLCLRRSGLLRSFKRTPRQLPTVFRRAFTIGLDGVIFRVGIQTVTLLLPVLLSVRAAGIFNAASKPLAMLVIGNSFIMRFFGPYIASAGDKDPTCMTLRIQMCHKLAFFFTGSVLVGALTFPHVICNILFGAKAEEIAEYMQVLAIAFIIYYAPPYSANLKAIGLERQVVWCGIIQWATMVVALFVLAPRYGVWGAVTATLLAYSAYWLTEVFLYSFNRLKGVANAERYLAYLFGSTALGFTYNQFPGGTLSIISFALTVLTLSLLVYWTPGEREQARWLLRNSLAPRRA